MTGDDEIIERLRRTLYAEADAITPRRVSDQMPRVRAVPIRPRRRRFGRMPLAALATAAAAAAATLLAVNWPSGGHTVGIGITSPRTSVAPTTAVTATTVFHPPTTVSAVVPTPQITAPTPVPAGFEPTSVTFVSTRDGWAAGTYRCGGRFCVAVARTYDAGQSWSETPAPPVAALSGQAGSSVSLRFADVDDGWLYVDGSPRQVYATHDGGAGWVPDPLPVTNGQITGLETSAGRVYAAVLDMSDLTVHVEASPVSSDSWTDNPTGVSLGAGPVASADIVLQGASGWIINDNRTVIGGAHLVGGRWEYWNPPCAGANGDASLAAPTTSTVFAVCAEGVMGPPSPAPAGGTFPSDWLWASTNGGETFKAVKQLPFDNLGLIAGATPSTLVISGALTPSGGQTQGLSLSTDGGGSWQTVYQAPTGEDVLYLGFTTPTQGVAIVGGGTTSTLLMTYDAGRTWSPVTF